MTHASREKEIVAEHPHSTDTVDKHMATHICMGSPTDTVDDYLKKLRKCTVDTEILNYAYIVDAEGVLLGHIPIAKLLKTDSTTLLHELMDKDTVTVHLKTDRERAARLAIHHELGSLPVVDSAKRLVGVVNSHSILQMLHEEHVEDMLRVAGFKHAHEGTFVDILKARTNTMIRVRTPWLIIGLIGGMFATFVVSIFEGPIKDHVTLAFFIPVLLYIASATATQTEALYLRLYDTVGFKFHAYLVREIKIGTAIGFICGSLIFLFALIFFNELKIAAIIGGSMFLTIIFAVCTATIIPALLSKFKKDPALGAGPLATVIQDIITILVYFTVAQIIL